MILDIRVIPSASKNEIQGFRDGVLRVRIAAPAVDGRANRALVDFLAAAFHLPRSSLVIVKGHTSHRKRIEIPIGLQEVLNLVR